MVSSLGHPAPEDSHYPWTSFRGSRHERCLHLVQKFQSDTERVLAVILDRASLKWFRPAAGQFQINYRLGATYHLYQPDFVAELEDQIVMLEPKARNQMNDADVLAKRDAAVAWCQRATEHAMAHGGKPWRYALIPHDAIAENWTINDLLSSSASKAPMA